MTRIPTDHGRYDHEFVDLELDEKSRRILLGATDAVCQELGLRSKSDARRQAVASSIASTWRDGKRLPLNLVNAGLDAIGA